jgi:hypothetical protein
MVTELHDWLENARRLPARQARQLQTQLKAIYRHTMHGDNPPPCGLDWTLSQGGVAKAIYEELTGESAEDRHEVRAIRSLEQD